MDKGGRGGESWENGKYENGKEKWEIGAGFPTRSSWLEWTQGGDAGGRGGEIMGKWEI